MSIRGRPGTAMKILVLGIAGMLGSTMFRSLSGRERFTVFGTIRDESDKRFFSDALRKNILTNVDGTDWNSVVAAYETTRPDVVINCIGIVKQLLAANDPLRAVPLNALLPHRVAALCRIGGSRFVQVSTDCVFSGARGNYAETDAADARDLYGLSKYLGEVRDAPGCLTIRTSIIGPELKGSQGLIGWFLAQTGPIKGFSRAIFSGLTTLELSNVMADFILTHPEIEGLYHVAAKPLDKHSLLKLVGEAYGKATEIVNDEAFVIDRSLDQTKFHSATGYVAPEWPDMIAAMRAFG